MKSNILTTTTATAATAAAANIEVAVNAFLANQDVRHNTPATYKRALKQFFVWVEGTGRHTDTLERTDVLTFKRWMEREDYSPNTINSYLTAIRRFYSFLELNGYNNIAKGIKSERTTNTQRFEKSDFTANQAAAILQAVNTNGTLRDIAILELMIRCGLRTIEVSRLTIADLQIIDTDTATLRVLGKGDKVRFVPVTAKALKAIQRYLMHDRKERLAGAEPLFASEAHQNNGGQLSTATISRIAKRYIRATGIDDDRHTAHSLRHTTAALIYEQSHDLDRIQQLLGHSNPATTQIYARQAMQRDFMKNSPNSVIDAIL